MWCTSNSSMLTLICITCLFSICSRAQQACRDEVECSARGACIYPDNNATWHCICDEGWTTHPVPNSTVANPVYCNYEQKQQLVAFLLSFFVGLFAAGRFYVGQYLTAGLKIALNIGLGSFGMCCISCVTGVSAFGSSSNRRSADTCCAKFMAGVGCCYVFLVTLGMFAWLIADWVLFGLNKIPDGNGVDLQPW